MSITTIEELKKKIVKNQVKPPEGLLPIELDQLNNVLSCNKSPLPMLPFSVLSYRKMRLSLKWSVPSFMLFNPFGLKTVSFMRARAMYGSRYTELQQTIGDNLATILMKNISLGHYETTFRGFFPPEVRNYLMEKKASPEGPLFVLAEAEWTTRELQPDEVDPFIVSICRGHFHIHKEFNLTSLEKTIKQEFVVTAE